jgi:DNA-binding transcriptional ArsR family regulator
MSEESIYDIQAGLCRTMSNAIRLEILHHLRNGPMGVSDIIATTGCSRNLISHHLGVLRHGGIIKAMRGDQDIHYQIANPKIIQVCVLMREVLVEEALRRSKLIEGLHDDRNR